MGSEKYLRRVTVTGVLITVFATAGCGGNEVPPGGGPTVDPTSYTTPSPEPTDQTPGGNTGEPGGNGILNIGGPNAENRNPSTPWPSIPVGTTAKTDRYGCTERHNTAADVPITIIRVQIIDRAPSPIRLVDAWDMCTTMGYTLPADRGCQGRTLQPAPRFTGRGCLLALHVGEFAGDEHRAVLRLTFQATCRSPKDRPCTRVPAAKLPATVRWSADETVTARVEGGARVTTTPTTTRTTSTTTATTVPSTS
ncbi:hypothetical protein [Amycolatopsis sp. NPDC057786]|uniref:hypothetical protein n=1 Tax=Amycolatopsis sp. NPDC057786 TaxID=3346250 RepID=UPI0036722DCC